MIGDRRLRARVLLGEAAALGIDLADLIAAATPTDPEAEVGDGVRVPTVAGHVETITATFTPGTARAYRSDWRLAVARLADRRLDDLTIADLQSVVDQAGRRARRNRPDSTGAASRETCVSALRALFGRAVAAGLVTTNPALALTKGRRTRSRRRALTDDELAELIAAVRATSNDPDLDLLLIRFHLESGARRQGALGLRRRDLDERRATVWLREKDSQREQRVSPSLVALLNRHATSRGALTTNDLVFRTTRGVAMTERRYDRIFDHARHCLDWTARTPVSAHVLRHTAITAVGRLAGYSVAQAFAGHSPRTVTGIYLHASPTEVATAIATLTGEAHPLDDSQHVRDDAGGRIDTCRQHLSPRSGVAPRTSPVATRTRWVLLPHFLSDWDWELKVSRKVVDTTSADWDALESPGRSPKRETGHRPDWTRPGFGHDQLLSVPTTTSAVDILMPAFDDLLGRTGYYE